ncbi:MAG: UpxY family transcription antiterminator [Mangrovibacterium sp.]
MESWFVFYTYPKAEKSVSTQLINAGYETYLPLQEEVRQWHDRKKKLQIPIFPNYIFIKTDIVKVYEVLKFPRIVRCVKFNNKPSCVREDEIELIKNIENNCTNVIVSNKLEKGEKVTIQGGPLNGLQGIIEESRDTRHIIVNIDSISYSLRVLLSPNEIYRIDQCQ